MVKVSGEVTEIATKESFPQDELSKIFRYLLYSAHKKAYLDEIERKFQSVPNLKKDLLSSTSFWMGQQGIQKKNSTPQQESNSWEVRPKVSINLCSDHVARDRMCVGTCGKLHLCKDNFLSATICSKPCKKGQSHYLFSPHNTPILAKVFPKSYHDENGKIRIVRASLPRLCHFYTETGNCNQGFCGYLHICPEVLRENCNGEECKQSKLSKISSFEAHNLGSNHNTKVLSMFGYWDIEKQKQDIMSNILFSSVTANYEKQNILPTVSIDCNLQKNVSPTQHRLLFCFKYLNSICKNKDCSDLHICKDFLSDKSCIDVCKFGFSHNLLDSSHNEKVLKKLNFLIPKSKVVQFVKSLFPNICQSYFYDETMINCDQSLTQCNKIHLCRNFLLKGETCGSQCSRSHSFRDQQNSRILKDFFIDVGEKENKIILTEAILFPKFFKMDNAGTAVCYNGTDKGKPILQRDDFNSFKEEAICCNYLNNECSNSSLCNLLHPDPKISFIWQYRKDTVWRSFPFMLNVELEIIFCDPTADHFESTTKQYLKVDFTTLGFVWNGNYNSQKVDVRRLSTHSSIILPEEEILEESEEVIRTIGTTNWKWYLMNSSSEWEEFRKWTCSSEIELAYIKNGCDLYFYVIGEYIYSINFDTMEQQQILDEFQNQKRPLRRRPTFKSRQDLKIKKTIFAQAEFNNVSYYPPHWPNMFFNGEKIQVNLIELEEIKQTFKDSMGSTMVDVISVKEICNAHWYKEYKSFLLSRPDGQQEFDEKMTFYHPTDEYSVESICLQNFDCEPTTGRKDLGQGCYFYTCANDADVHCPRSNFDLKFMFVAKMFVGNCTKGDTSYKQPPLIGDNVIIYSDVLQYDSCIDILTNNVYVKFDKKQYYPQYLIKYRHIDNDLIKSNQPIFASNSFPVHPWNLFIPKSISEIVIGTSVIVHTKSGQNRGTVMWTGLLDQQSGEFVGVKLNSEDGDSDGSIDGVQYFSCKPLYGIFVKCQKVFAWRTTK